ncbi:MAG TPA: tRNA (adenosine(37)-N6)-threonylcarbamoyltransferase complex dimerization subunit type 1 TsaB [Pirellulaceae bacterium]|nr:tRNA (adenosine(37)-N6)-threonylcarbamoyltransferase complex dimerization subunit type 1 TsaB [Pirellulaceae bacterium]
MNAPIEPSSTSDPIRQGPAENRCGAVIETGATGGAEGAIIVDDRIVAHDRLPDGERSARGLIPMLDRLIRSTGRSPGDLDWLGLTLGPGSFTGLRVGITFAKMLALAGDVRLVGVDSFEPYERWYRDQVAAGVEPAGRFVTLLDAQRRQFHLRSIEIFAEGDASDDAAPTTETPTSDVRIVDASTCGEELRRGDRVGGAVADRLDPELLTRTGATLVAPAGRSLPFESLVSLCIERERRGETIPGHRLLPRYGRASAAEEKRRERH